MTKQDRILRGRGVIDRNGFPVLDPPGARNRLPKRCHDRMHKFKTVNSKFVDHDVKTGKDVYSVERVCTVCRHQVTETRWF